MTLRPCCSGTKETMAGPSPASRLVSSGSNLLLMILLACYGVTVPFFQGRTVSEAAFIILGYKEVVQFLSTNLSMIVLKGQLPNRSKVRGLTLAKVSRWTDWWRRMAQSCRKNQHFKSLYTLLLHRLLLKCPNSSWWSVASNLQNLCGPSSLCYRPFFMEISFLNHCFQERCNCPRLFLSVHCCCWPAWSVTIGIAFTPDRKFFVQLCWLWSDGVQVRCHASPIYLAYFARWIPMLETCFQCFFADFVHAFPRAWRALILAEAGVSAGTRDGALALLASFLKEWLLADHPEWWFCGSGR